MGKRLTSGSEIVKQSNDQLLTPEQKRTSIVGYYLYKFGAIANRPIDDELISIYVEALAEFETERMEKGLKAYLSSGTRWPWPGDLANYIEEEV